MELKIKILLILLFMFSAHSATAGIENDLCLNEYFDLAQKVAFESFDEDVETLELYTNLANEQMHWDAGRFFSETLSVQPETTVKASDALGLVFVSRVRNDVHKGVTVSPISLVSEGSSQIGMEQEVELTMLKQEIFLASKNLESGTPYVTVFNAYDGNEDLLKISLSSLSSYTSLLTNVTASKVHMCAYLVVQK